MKKIGRFVAAALIGGVVLVGAVAAGGAVLASSPVRSNIAGSGSAGGAAIGQTQAGSVPQDGNRPRLLAGAYHADGTWQLVDGTTRTTTSDAGEITAVGSDSLTIERRDGESITAPVDDQTCIRKDGQPAALADLAVGERALLVQSGGTALAVKAGLPPRERDRQGCGFVRLAVHGDVTVHYLDGSTRTITYDAGRITSIGDGQVSFTRRDGQSVTLSYDDASVVIDEGQVGSVEDLSAGEGAMFFSEDGKIRVVRCLIPASGRPAGDTSG